LLVARQDDTVEYRPVPVGDTTDGLAVIEKGVGPEDRVIVNGVQRARPGAKVAPEDAPQTASRE